MPRHGAAEIGVAAQRAAHVPIVGKIGIFLFGPTCFGSGQLNVADLAAGHLVDFFKNRGFRLIHVGRCNDRVRAKRAGRVFIIGAGPCASTVRQAFFFPDPHPQPRPGVATEYLADDEPGSVVRIIGTHGDRKAHCQCSHFFVFGVDDLFASGDVEDLIN